MFCSSGEVVFIHSDQVDKTCPSTLIVSYSEGLLLGCIRGDIKSIYPELALDGSKNECTRTDTVFFSLSQVCTRWVTLNLFNFSFLHLPSSSPFHPFHPYCLPPFHAKTNLFHSFTSSSYIYFFFIFFLLIKTQIRGETGQLFRVLFLCVLLSAIIVKPVYRSIIFDLSYV